jgi:hypothetical protein
MCVNVQRILARLAWNERKLIQQFLCNGFVPSDVNFHIRNVFMTWVAQQLWNGKIILINSECTRGLLVHVCDQVKQAEPKIVKTQWSNPPLESSQGAHGTICFIIEQFWGENIHFFKFLMRYGRGDFFIQISKGWMWNASPSFSN